jgi:predicted Ser/Thr protein kinase
MSETLEQRQCPGCGVSVPADAPKGLCPQCLLKGAFGTGPYAGPTAPTVEELETHFPQLEIIELIGQGGMGAVYKARQPALDRLVAVKVLPREAGADPTFAERFSREARALARLSHSHIVAVHDVGRAGDYYYFVMEYVDGANLREVLRDGKLTPEQALRIVPQICDALQYAHEEGVVHRDIKPENILLDRKGRVKIADFGLAKLLGRDTGDFTLTGSRQVMGTLYYMAPEQVERPLEVDHRADIYSLGVVFYEMLTGQLPVGRFPMPSQKAGTDAFLDEVVLHALEREPDRRYQHASDVKTDVERGAREAQQTEAPTIPRRAFRAILAIVRPHRAAQRTEAPTTPRRGSWEDAENARRRVKWPAVALMWVALVNWLLLVPSLIVYNLTHQPGLLSLLVIALILATTLTFVGALKMKRLESRGLALAGAISALLSLPILPLAWPFGIWALTVLTAPEVTAAFARRKRENLSGHFRGGL